TRVVLWLVPGNSQAIIERQPSRDFPIILDVAFDVPVPVKPFRKGAGLRIAVVHAQQRVSEWMPRIERVVGVVEEVDVSVRPREARLILAAALRVKTRLERMRADDLRDVVNEVESVVLIDERQPVEIGEWESLVGDAAVTEVRRITGAD